MFGLGCTFTVLAVGILIGISYVTYSHDFNILLWMEQGWFQAALVAIPIFILSGFITFILAKIFHWWP